MQNYHQLLIDLDKKMTITKRMQLYLLAAVSLVCFLIILRLNYLSVICRDDYIYSFIYPSHVRVQSFSDIIQSLHNHYFLWGGRMVAHFIVQTLLMINPLVADILNSAAYVLCMYLIYWHILGKSRAHSVSLFLLINLLMWFFQPSYGDCILWITSSGNYLWCMLLILLFLLPFRLYENDTQRSKLSKVIKISGMFLLGLLAGCTNENTALAMIFMAIVAVYCYRRVHWQIPTWAIIGIVGALIGYVFMVVAPGNFVRATISYSDKSLHGYCYRFMITTLRYFASFDANAFINACALLLFILLYQFNRHVAKKNLPTILIYVSGIFISIYVMMASPTFPGRSSFGATTFSIIIFGILYLRQNNQYIFLRYIKRWALFILLAAFPFSFYNGYKDLKLNYLITQDNNRLIKDAKARGEMSVTVSLYTNTTKYVVPETDVAPKELNAYYGIIVKFK